MLKKIGILVVLLVLIVLGLAATKADTFSLQREATINAPRERVYSLVNDFHEWGKWSPWEQLDPNMKRVYGGTPSGVGSTYGWEGNSDAGAGEMAILSSTAPSKVEIQLDFTKPFESHNVTEFVIDSTAAGTYVVWSMRGPNPFISKIMSVFISVDKMVGPDFERGLASLKAEAEETVVIAKKSAKKSSVKHSMARPDAKPAKKAPQSKPYAEGKWAAEFTRAKGERRNWLMKSEPDAFSFDDLLAANNKTTHWDGVRNTGARNFLRDALKKGDRVLYYHSNADPSAIVGTAEVVKEGYPDDSAFDPKSDYYDAASDPENPMWYMVDVRAVKKLANPVTLADIKASATLTNMALIRVSRLAVVPVTDAEWDVVMKMSERKQFGH